MKLTSPSTADTLRTKNIHVTFDDNVFVAGRQRIQGQSCKIICSPLKKKIYLCVCVFACHMCVGSLGGQKKKVLELEL